MGSFISTCMRLIVTSLHSNLAKGRIADLSPLVAANGFVRCWPTSIAWFLAPTWLSPQTASRSVQPFSLGMFVWLWFEDKQTQTDTHRQTTLRVTSVEIGRVYAVHAMRPHNVTNCFFNSVFYIPSQPLADTFLVRNCLGTYFEC